jgi:hypothetical protein
MLLNGLSCSQDGRRNRSHRPRPWPFPPLSVSRPVLVRGPFRLRPWSARPPEPGRIADGGIAARCIRQRTGRYLDPVSLASLIVAIATLAWTIYNDQRNRTPSPPAEGIASQVRITLREQDTALPEGTERITEIIATEITRRANPSD